ncbi:Ldh family oxidoreductase [Bernardetia sp. OM2101]|uniref:Ldh family oxidoreductase n=1 Tax=Bernardetia sp. OM2101 TaxID=3344876 RepID=UPI0035D114D1
MEVLIDYNNIYNYINLILESLGIDKKTSESCAESLSQASLQGIDSHGVRLLPHYVSSILEGRISTNSNIEINQVTPCIAKINGNHSFAYGSGMVAINKAIEMAEIYGVGIVSLSNSNHMGTLSHYGLEAAKKDMIGVVMTSTTPKMSTPNGKKAFFGTNPLCITAPMLSEQPFCFDAATTSFTGNKVKHYKNNNKPLPLGVAKDKNGEDTTDATLAYYLTGIGQYKGFGLAMAIDIFSSFLTNMPFADEVSSMYDSPLSQKRYLGHFFMVLDIKPFGDIHSFKENLQNLTEKIRSSEKVDNKTPIYVPGDIEKLIKQERLISGIPIDLTLQNQLFDIAKKMNISTHFLKIK